MGTANGEWSDRFRRSITMKLKRNTRESESFAISDIVRQRDATWLLKPTSRFEIWEKKKKRERKKKKNEENEERKEIKK